MLVYRVSDYRIVGLSDIGLSKCWLIGYRIIEMLVCRVSDYGTFTVDRSFRIDSTIRLEI